MAMLALAFSYPQVTGRIGQLFLTRLETELFWEFWIVRLLMDDGLLAADYWSPRRCWSSHVGQKSLLCPTSRH